MTNMKKVIYLSAVLALAAFGASNAAAQLQDGSTMNSSDKMQMSGKKNPDAKFMMMAAMGGMNEIGLSQTALSKSSNDEVKRFAQMMIDDHSKAGDELKTVAQSKNVMLTMEMDEKHKAMNQKMMTLTGSKFDMEYVKAMVKDHEKTVAMFQKEASGGKDADAKAFAAKNLPVIQAHLDMARKMMTSMSGGKKMDDNKMSGM
jgi:putative membrane protein